MNRIVIDAANARLGRLVSYAAKQSLLGKEVIIVNCKAAIITGGRRSIINEYKVMRQRGGHSLKGPHFPLQSERIVKRTLRGMLSYKQGRGAEAFKRVICFSDIPAEYASQAKPFKAQKPTVAKFIEVGDLSKEI